MGNNKKLRRDGSRRGRDRQDDSSSADTSDEAFAEETTRKISSDALVTPAARRKTRGKEVLLINIFRELKKIHKKLNKLTKSHRELCKQLEPNTNGSSGDVSATTPRSELNQGNELKYRLKIDCQVNERIDKGQIIETNLGKTIRVILCDDQGEIVRTGPLSSAKVMLVVVYGDFNQHGIHDSWSQKDFERKIKRALQGNSGTEDVYQPVQSVVSNCVFKLASGEQNYSDATILSNSRNQKVKLGVMVLSPTEERVLEGLSNPFKVRDPVKPGRKRKAPAGNNPNDPRSCSSGLNPNPRVMPSPEASANTSILQASFPHLMMGRTSINQPQCCPPGLHPSATPLQHPITTVVPSTVPSPNLQGHFSHPSMSSAITDDQSTCNRHAGGEEPLPIHFWEEAEHWAATNNAELDEHRRINDEVPQIAEKKLKAV